MMSKSVAYKAEQQKVLLDLIQILELQTRTTYTLLELDNDPMIQEQIMELIPRIKNYFNCNNIKSASHPEKIKRPWLSIIKIMLKDRYQIVIEDIHIKQEAGNFIHSKKYTFRPLRSMRNALSTWSTPDSSSSTTPASSANSSPQPLSLKSQ